MRNAEIADFLQYVGKDPSALAFEDELTGLRNRRYLLSYLEHKVGWTSDSDFPLALLSMDLDRFKLVNDTHGHAAGDQALTWVASILRDVAGESGIPVRFGGDEFMLLLPKTDLSAARSVAARLLQHSRDRPFRERDSGAEVPMSLSIGIAVAPDDGKDRESLFDAADAALYVAKNAGRNQAAVAADIDQSAVVSKTALQRLRLTGIAGRDREMQLVDEALRDLEADRSQLLVFEGAPGSGKTTLLDAINRNLKSDDTAWVLKATGDPREGGRPYYLASRILVNLLGQHVDRGASLLGTLDEEARGYLSHVLPGLTEEDASGDVDRGTREGIFTTFIRFLRDAVGSRTLILLIDDIQLADEATLHLLRAATERGGLALFLCGTVGESLVLSGRATPSPVETVMSERSEAIGVRRAVLTPLGASDVTEYLRGMFPNVRIPEGFDADLARVTGGNPFFLTEIVHCLMEDRKVHLEGQRWVIDEVEADYLARSLEEIVTEKIAALDGADRDILERASTLGEEIPVSVLAGSSELDEIRVQDFLDRAEALGLVSLDFQVNDEVMHFLGKRILDISYKAISDDRKKELHEELGRYHERLYEKKLLPSASMLAYHFRRSANDAKALRYERAHLEHAGSIFDATEVSEFAIDGPDDVLDPGIPLDERALTFLPQVFRTVLSATRNLELYPDDSEVISRALDQAKTALDAVLGHTERLTLTHSDDVLEVNGEEVNLPEAGALLSSTLSLLSRAELSGLSVAAGIDTKELRAVLGALGKATTGTVGPDFWSDTAADLGLEHVELRQIRFKRVAASGPVPAGDTEGSEGQLTPSELEAAPMVLRDMLRAVSSVKLYPIESESVTEAIDGLLDSVRPLIRGRPVLTFARVEDFVLVNGTRLETSRWQAVADGFVDLLEGEGLDSLSFFSTLSRADVEGFLGALKNGSPEQRDPEFWEDFAATNNAAGMAFNQGSYTLGTVQALVAHAQALASYATTGVAGGKGPRVPRSTRPPQRPEQGGESPESVADAAKELLTAGRLEEARALLNALFADFAREGTEERLAIVRTCSEIMGHLVPGLQHTLAGLALDPLCAALGEASRPVLLEQLGELMYELAASAIQFSDYQLAKSFYALVEARREGLRTTGAGVGTPYAALAAVSLDEATKQLLGEDLQSGRPDRQERASLVLGAIGPPAASLLINLIKLNKDLRVRQMGSGILREMGDSAAVALKETLLTEVLVEQRFRVLEVVDRVTRDLRTELAFSLADESPKIRRAAFQLFDRLADEDLLDLILPLLQGTDPATAKGAVRSLTDLGTPLAAEALANTLRGTREPGLAAACCQALGSLKAEDAIQRLSEILGAKRFGFFGYKWPEHVRAAAAAALRQIGSPWATEVLVRHAKDRSSRIREIARQLPPGATPPTDDRTRKQ